MADRIQIRRDTAANWTSVDPTLAQGEIGYELDTNKFKWGDGSTAWTSLPYSTTALDEFTELIDTPANYTGDANKLVAVNSTPDALEFITTIDGSIVLGDGVTATTQSPSDNTTKVATTAYVDAQVATEDTFIELNDTPSSYTSQEGKIPRVNATPDALEFIDNWDDTRTCYVSPDYTDDDTYRKYSTIQAAIDYANSQTPSDTSRWLVYIKNGEYDETLTLYDHIYFQGQNSDTCIIKNSSTIATITSQNNAFIGLTFEATGTNSILTFNPGSPMTSYIRFNDCLFLGAGNNNNIIDISANTLLIFTACSFRQTASTANIVTISNDTDNIVYFYNSRIVGITTLDGGTTYMYDLSGIGAFDLNNACNVTIENCQLLNPTGTLMELGTTGQLNFFNTTFMCPGLLVSNFRTMNVTANPTAMFMGMTRHMYTVAPPDYLVYSASVTFQFNGDGNAFHVGMNSNCTNIATDTRKVGSIVTEYNNIQDAIDASSAGDTVLVQTGTYNGAITLADGVTVRGESAPGDVVIVQNTGAVCTVSSGTSYLENITLQSTPTAPGASIIYSALGGTLVSNNVVYSMNPTNTYATVTDMQAGLTIGTDTTVTYTHTGTGGGDHVLVNLGANGATSGNVSSYTMTVESDDDVYGLKSVSNLTGNAKSGLVNMNITVSNATYSSDVYGIHHTGSAEGFLFDSSSLVLEATGASVTGTGTLVYMNNGSAKIRSLGNFASVTGFANNYFNNVVNAGDTYTSHFDDIMAADGVLGAGTYNFVNSPADGDIQVSGSYLNMFDDTYTIAPRGGDYTTIQGALDDKPDAGALFIVEAGTYTNDTINFTANNQTVIGAGDIDSAEITNTTAICDFGAFTGCTIEQLKLNMTATTDVACVTGSGSLNINNCEVLTTASGASATGGAVVLNTTGTVVIKFGSLTLNSTVISAGQVKRAINLGTGCDVLVSRADLNMTCSGNILGTTGAYGTGTGVISFVRSIFNIEDDAALITTAIFLGGSGTQTLTGNTIVCNNDGAGNTAYGYYLSTATSMTVDSSYNSITCTSSAGAARPYVVGGGVTLNSNYDTINTAQPATGAGTINYSGSLGTGDLDASNDITAENDITATSGNIEATAGNITAGAGFEDTGGTGLLIPTPAATARNNMVRTDISGNDYGIDYYAPAASQGRITFTGNSVDYGYIEVEGTNAGDFYFQDSTTNNAFIWDASTPSAVLSNSTNFITLNGSNGYIQTTNGTTTYSVAPNLGIIVPTNYPAFTAAASANAGLWFSGGAPGSRFAYRDLSSNEILNLQLNGGIALGTYAGTNAPPANGIIAPGNVGIGTSSVTASTKLEIASTTGAVLLPRMTAAQAGALTATNGHIVYVTSTDATFTSVGVWAYENGAWAKL